MICFSLSTLSLHELKLLTIVESLLYLNYFIICGLGFKFCIMIIEYLSIWNEDLLGEFDMILK